MSDTAKELTEEQKDANSKAGTKALIAKHAKEHQLLIKIAKKAIDKSKKEKEELGEALKKKLLELQEQHNKELEELNKQLQGQLDATQPQQNISISNLTAPIADDITDNEVGGTHEPAKEYEEIFPNSAAIEKLSSPERESLFAEQKSFINNAVAKAKVNKREFIAVGKPKIDGDFTIYKYRHPDKEMQDGKPYKDDDCITYKVAKDGSTTVIYGKDSGQSIIFAKPLKETAIGGQMVISNEGSHKVIGDERNSDINISNQKSSFVNNLKEHTENGTTRKFSR